MRPERRTIVGLLLLTALAASSGCATLRAGSWWRAPEARITNVSVQNFKIDSATILFQVEVKNPSRHPLRLTDVSTTLSHAGAPFLARRTEVSQILPPRFTKRLSLPLDVAYADALANLSGARRGALLPFQAALALSLSCEGRADTLYLRSEGRLPLAAVPQVRIAEVQWDLLNTQRAEGRALVHCDNPNAFPVLLRLLAYRIDLGAAEAGEGAFEDALVLGPEASKFRELPIAIVPSALGAVFPRMLRGEDVEYRLVGTLEVDTQFGTTHLPIDLHGKTPCRK